MGTLIAQHWHGNATATRVADRRAGQIEAHVPHMVATWHPLLPADAAAAIAEAEQELRQTASDLEMSQSADGVFFWAESLGSSRIEGIAPSTRQVVHALVRKQHAPDREFHDSVFQVVGNIEATNAALQTLADRQNMSVQSILDAHRTLMDSSPMPHLGGVIRTYQSWVGGNDWHPLDGGFVPPPADRCGALMGDLVDYLSHDDHSPILQAAIAHAQFETIHPFGDGNGRTGRALLYGVLKHRCAQGGMMPPVSLALSRNKERYLDSLAEFQTYIGGPDEQGRSEALMPWVDVLASSVRQSCAGVRKYQDAVQQLQQKWREEVGGRRNRSAALAAIDHLPANPSMSAKVLEDLSGFTQKRCADALRRLEVLGIVKGRRADAGLRVYDADRIFSAYEVMASTISDINASPSDYAVILDHPFMQEQAAAQRQPVPSGDTSWAVCPLAVKSTNLPCGLAKGHGGHCRHLSHRKTPPR